MTDRLRRMRLAGVVLGAAVATVGAGCQSTGGPPAPLVGGNRPPLIDRSNPRIHPRKVALCPLS